jgi:hypothetical protein
LRHAGHLLAAVTTVEIYAIISIYISHCRLITESNKIYLNISIKIINASFSTALVHLHIHIKVYKTGHKRSKTSCEYGDESSGSTIVMKPHGMEAA